MTVPQAIKGLREIVDRFDAVLLDQLGALHTGKAVFPAARRCVEHLRAAGKKILVLSNSGKRSQENAMRLADLGLPPELYDGVLTSGEVTWAGLRDRADATFAGLGNRCFLISRGNDRSPIAGLPIEQVDDIAHADFILLAGLDDRQASHAFWESAFREAAARGVPLICANPDITMFGATELLPAAGAIAAQYAAMGGAVTYVGKPHPPIFAAAMRALGQPPSGRVIVIGDSLDHDVFGGRLAGMLTVLITSGVHADILRPNADVVEGVTSMVSDSDRRPHWLIEHLVW